MSMKIQILCVIVMNLTGNLVPGELGCLGVSSVNVQVLAKDFRYM